VSDSGEVAMTALLVVARALGGGQAPDPAAVTGWQVVASQATRIAP